MRPAVLLLAVAVVLPVSAQAQAELPRVQIERVLETLESSPPIDEVVEAARRAARPHPTRVRDAIERARVAGLLPALRAGVRRGQSVDLRGLETGGLGEPTNISTDDALTVEASMTFRLDRLIFAPEEPTLLRELRVVETEMERRIDLVVRLYFERQRVRLEARLLAATPASLVRVRELEALLDVFTEGAFTRMMAAER